MDEVGMKYDTDKPRVDLVMSGFANAIEQVSKVGTFGADKYGDFNWRHVDNGIERYLSAMLRHYLKYRQGEEIDSESGLSHLTHMAWNALAVSELYECIPKDTSEECNCHCKEGYKFNFDKDIDDSLKAMMNAFYGTDM